MRVIAGSARGRSLDAPRGDGTRPTLDRVREAMFNLLQTYVPDARALDLFAGSGALGIEALSRGAASVTFVERGHAAAQIVRKNLEAVDFLEPSQLLTMDYRRAIILLSKRAQLFDLVLLDPPYAMDGKGILRELRDAGILIPGAVICLESGKDTAPKAASGYTTLRQRAYGDTELTIYRFEEERDDAVDVSGEL